ncbi:MAG: SMC family ATPase, partial [Lachnospiraceae bacterium]|nr:SMC family ATPase [Lachnospiraceae bacterium]
TNQQEAAERRKKLLTEINTLRTKKTATEQNVLSQKNIVASADLVLNDRQEIETKVAEYNVQIEKEKELATEAALYSSKQAEAYEVTKQLAEEELKLDELNKQLASEEQKKTALESPVNEDVIRQRCAEYEKYSGLEKEMKDLQTKYMAAKTDRDHKAYAVDSKKSYINQEVQKLESKKADLIRRTELLQNSGCPDIGNAKCRFLSDALEAKEQLPAIDEEISAFKSAQEILLEKLIAVLKKADEAVDKVGFDEELLHEYSLRVMELSDAPEQLRKMTEREHQISLISASIEHIQSNISECEKTVSTVKLKVADVERERDKYEKSFAEHNSVKESIIGLKPWLEKEKQLPVAEERKNTATQRITELSAEIETLDKDIATKTMDAEAEKLAINGIADLEVTVAGLDMDINALNERIREYQMLIGAYSQRAEQISKLKQEIAALQKQQVEYAKETSDYDALKLAFSQSGVPHQIIRSIIPQLTATANSILGQMTGGKMGVEFKLERVQKNGKEKVSLDIFIEEYGKAVLPYLSKSGGEKVKSSLSVILALAEIKSSSAGIQLGMLFIDEPPFLDGDGIQAYCDALETIQSRYQNIKIMAITHDPTMKARFPQNLDVVKTENGSKVIYQ